MPALAMMAGIRVALMLSSMPAATLWTAASLRRRPCAPRSLAMMAERADSLMTMPFSVRISAAIFGARRAASLALRPAMSSCFLISVDSLPSSLSAWMQSGLRLGLGRVELAAGTISRLG